VTASATNRLHGSAFEFLRNSAFDARNFFDQTIDTPPYKRNQFGGSLGGPLKKDKMFLFGTYEGYQQRLAVSSASIVPGTAARKGLMPDGSSVPGLKPEMLKYANAMWPAPSTPDRPDGTAIAYANPKNSVGENFGLARYDYVISSKDSFSANPPMMMARGESRGEEEGVTRIMWLSPGSALKHSACKKRTFSLPEW